MVKKLSVQVSDIVKKNKAKLRKVVVDSITDVCREAQTSAQGITAGGTLVDGKIPVVTADLINSFTSRVGGGIAKGANSYVAAIAGINLGETAVFIWDIEYAMRVNYGFMGTDALGRTYNQKGWHFATRAVEKWPEFVKKNAAKVSKE